MTKRDLDLEKEWRSLKRKLENKNKESELEEEVEEAEEKISSIDFAKFIEQAPSVEEKTVLLDKVEEIHEQPNLEENIDFFTKSPREEFNVPILTPINEPKYFGGENKYVPAEFKFETSRAGIKIETPENMRRMDFLNPLSLRSELMSQKAGYPDVMGPKDLDDNKKYMEKEY